MEWTWCIPGWAAVGGFGAHWVTHEALFARDFVSLGGYWDGCVLRTPNRPLPRTKPQAAPTAVQAHLSFCASSIEKLRRAIDSDLFNTFQDESTAETRIILNITQQRPNRASVLLLSSNPQDRQVRSLSFILDSYDRMRELEQQVDQLRSNREAIMGDLSSYCDLLREELQSILDVRETTGPVTNPPSPPLNAGSILNGAVGIRIERGNIINFSGTSNSIYQGSGIGVRT
ncbi:hypothetical protein F5887DRAFT_916091 [Amanita rubescens]|nr:hypothetical protein F5887DRAFT_916091 [Amanita rubescens]